MAFKLTPKSLLALAMLGMTSAPWNAHAEFTAVDGIVDIYDKFVTLQPIRVCSDDGSECGDAAAAYRDFAIKTYAQAGVALAFLPTKTINFDAGVRTSTVANFLGPGMGQSTNQRTLNSWFVLDIVDADAGDTTYGEAFIGGNGLVVDSAEVLKAVRMDTYAHELGHNFGLDHNDFGAGGSDNLVTNGDDRNSPTSVLTQEQIDHIRSSQFLSETPKIALTQTASADGASTLFNLKFESLPDDIDLRRLTIDLPDLNLVDPHPGLTGRPYEYLLDLRLALNGEPLSEFRGDAVVSLDGFVADDIDLHTYGCATDLGFSVCYAENSQVFFPTGDENFPTLAQYLTTQGEAEIVFDFGVGDIAIPFIEGDELSFSINLLEHHLYEEVATPFSFERDVTGSVVSFEYDFGLSTLGLLAPDGVSMDSRRITAIFDSVDTPAPFGPQFAPGEVPPFAPLADPETLHAVPLPASLGPTLLGLAVLGARRRKNS